MQHYGRNDMNMNFGTAVSRTVCVRLSPGLYVVCDHRVDLGFSRVSNFYKIRPIFKASNFYKIRA